MRHMLVLGMLVLMTAEAVGADKPIPQDPVKSEKRRRDLLEWNRRTTLGAYDKIGKKNPKWDKPAREALDLAARMSSHQIEPAIKSAEIYKQAKAAVDAGCDDQMIIYIYNRFMTASDSPGVKEAIRRMKAAAKALAASGYPAFRRATGLYTAGVYPLSIKEPSEEVRDQSKRDFDAALALLPTSVATDERNEFWEEKWFETLNSLIQGYRSLGMDGQAAQERVDAVLAKIPGLKALRLQLRGFFWLTYGGEARGRGFADRVPEDAVAAFHQRVRIAQAALNEAWKVRPDAKTAGYMIGIEKAIGGGNRATMELWFDRALTADGDMFSACLDKLDWLDPMWHGTPDDLLVFGHACAATKNWRSKITLLAGDAHIRFAQTLRPADRSNYFRKPEVWAEIKSVYDEYLKHFPDDAAARTRYADLAYQSSHFPEAHAEFEKLGDRLTVWPYSPFTPLDSLKRCRDQTAKIVAGKAGGGGVAPEGMPAGWIGFGGRNSDGSWNVKLPVRPERKQEAGILGARARNVFTCTADGVTYTIRVQPVPAAAKGAQAVLSAARDAIAKERNGKVVDEHAATFGELPAQEFKIDAPALRPSVVRVRLAVIGTRLYEVSATGPEANATTAKFLDSFAFQK